jgi:hypothetical protein
MSRSRAVVEESSKPAADPTPTKAPAPRKQPAAAKSAAPPEWPVRAADLLVLLGFLALTFALGVFHLNDTDFWWHLRTGDLIRLHGRVPQTDWYTYTVPNNAWIDLHWGFEVLLSWGYAHGGVVTLNLAKCAITTLAVFLLISARRRDWPWWAMVLAWLPAVFVLGGRMYVRPETLSLLYIAIYMAVIFRWNQFPWLAFLLPAVQVLWVNTQGLFVFGPALLVCGLIDAALRPGAFSPQRKRWWRTILSAAVLVGVACLVNPYGVRGALFPIELSQTMGNPLFASTIGELTPIPTFIARAGLSSVPLRLHLLVIVVGGLSFLLPLLWVVGARLTNVEPPATTPRKKKRSKSSSESSPRLWMLSPFRILLYLALSLLSLRATRNSHQFAAIVGAVTAWNIGEWVASMRARKLERREASSLFAALVRRSFTLAVVSLSIVGVLSGWYYTVCAEGRTVGLGERPLWFAHDAVKFAAQPGMPEHGLVFHNGLAALYDYHAGPERKVFADARLEVIGPELYERYMALGARMRKDKPGWEEEILKDGRPVIVIDNLQEDNPEISATLMSRRNWRCMWFDPIAAVYLHEDDVARLGIPPVDFAGRHYLGRTDGLKTSDELLASARALKYITMFLTDPNRRDGDRALAAQLVTLGLEHARRAAVFRPDWGDPWKLSGQLEALRDPVGSSSTAPRFRGPFDPIHDIHSARATHDLLRALELGTNDFTTIAQLAAGYLQRGMPEAALPLVEMILEQDWKNGAQKTAQAKFRTEVTTIRAAMGPPPVDRWNNQNELGQILSSLLNSGRAESAAKLIERAYPRAEARAWETADQLATLRLHLGHPALAREAWASVANPTRPALQAARVAVCYLVEGDFETARRQYQKALEAEPKLFEALYGLAIVEQDDAQAAAAVSAADRAAENAPSPLARELATAIANDARPFARPKR